MSVHYFTHVKVSVSMRSVSFLKIGFLMKRYFSLVEKTFSLRYWKNNGSITIIELSDGSVESLITKPALLQDIKSGKRPDILSLKDQEDLLSIELASFDSTETDSLRALLRTLTTKNGVHFLFRDNGVLVGYVCSMPADRFDINKMHEGFDLRYDNLYMYSIAGKIDFFKTIGMLKVIAEEMSYKKLLAHCIDRRLVKVEQRLGFEKIAIIPNYLNGKEAAYMEMKILTTS